MAASRKKVVESFTQISGIGPAYAEQLYDEFGLRSYEDFVAAGEKGELQKLRGVGAAKEKALVKAAKALVADAKPAKAPENKAKSTKADAKKSTKADAKKSTKADAKKSTGSKAKSSSKPKPAKAPKAATPEAKAKKEEPKKEEPKKAAAKEEPKKEAPKKESPQRNRSSDFEDRARASKSSPGKRPTIPGLLFKIGKKLVSRLLS